MVQTILLVVFYIGFPILVIFLNERKLAFVDKIGPVIICYAAGIIAGNIGILPTNAAAVQDMVTSAAIPLALPLIFFSLDIAKWRATGGKAILSFVLETVSVILVSAAGFLIFRNAVGPEANTLAGMLTGVYTGGTVNLAAIGTALGAAPALYVAANASDVVISGLYLLFLLTVGRKVIGVFLKPFDAAAAAATGNAEEDYGSYKGIFSRGVRGPLAAAFGVAILIAAVGASLTFLLPREWGTVAAILLITTLGITASFIKPLRRVRKTHQLGNYFILVFCLAIGSMADFSRLASAIPAVLGYMSFAVVGSLILHVALCALFRIDTDTMIVTSVAGICSPPFVPMIASALKNRNVLLPGILTGVMGWVIGTYIGIGLGYLLPMTGM